MRRLLIALLATSAATPALAQHSDHAMPASAIQEDKGEPAKEPADPHANHNAGEQPGQSSQTSDDPHAGHVMPAAANDPHAGHATPSAPASKPTDPHAGHGAPEEPGMSGPPVAPPSAAALSGPRNAADALFGTEAMSDARNVLRKEHGDIKSSMLLIDQLETTIRNGRDGYAWDAQAWYGADIDRIWVKTEGEGSFGKSPERAEVQALWSHALNPWFNVQTGIRHDFRPDPERTHLVLGIQGLAPYWFEIDGAMFLSDKGDLTARFEAEYEQRLTQKLVLQPNIEFNLAAQDVPELGVGSGLSSGELGLRLRYQLVPEFAPYLGVKYERAFGNTADFSRARGEDVGGWSFLVGLRSWF